MKDALFVSKNQGFVRATYPLRARTLTFYMLCDIIDAQKVRQSY